MRFFFHIIDRHGLFPDKIGSEHVDQDAAAHHAKHIAAELSKAGELFRAGFVFVSSLAATHPSSDRDQGAAADSRDTAAQLPSSISRDCSYRQSRMSERERRR
jgi:hypothetical protein